MEEQEVNRMRDMALRYFEGHLVSEEEKILFNFLQESDVNVQLFRNWEDEWFAVSQKDLYIENKWNRLSGRLQINQWQMVQKKTKRYTFTKKLLPYAAIFILGVMSSVIVYFGFKVSDKSSDRLAQSEYFVPLGSQSKILLPDGSEVWLNAGSKLKYDKSFGDESRTVYIEGEAVFDVTRNKKVPFVVKNERMEVTVHGTIFNVKSFTEDSISSIELMRGAVSVNYSFSSQKIALTPGERLIINSKTRKVRKEEFDVASHLSWHEGILAFCDEPLSEIAEKLERRFGVDIIIKSETLKSRKYYLTFVNNETIDQILDKMKEDKNIHIRKKNNQIEIY